MKMEIISKNRNKIFWFLIGVLTTAMLAPIINPPIETLYLKIGCLEAPDIEITIARSEELEVMYRDKGAFYGIEWEDNYQIYGISITNPSKILLENVYLAIDFPSLIVYEHIEHGGIIPSVEGFGAYIELPIPEAEPIPLRAIPIRKIRISELPSNESVKILILIDLGENPIWEFLMQEISIKEKIKPGTYFCKYEWESRNGRRVEQFTMNYDIE